MNDLKTCNIEKGCTCTEETSAYEVAKELHEKKMRYMIVLNANDEPVGIISTVDISNRVVAEDKDPKATKASEIMTKEILSIEDCTELEHAYELMVKNGKNFIPVVNNKRFIGLVDMYQVAVAISKKYEGAQ